MRKYIYKIFSFLTAGLFIFLTYYSFRYSYINADFLDEILHEVKDNMLFNVLWLIGILGVGLVVVKFSEKIHEKWFLYILLLINILALVFGRYWLLNSHSLPTADSSLIYQTAKEFSAGDYLSMSPYGGYVGKCPHQLGIITFIRMLSFVTGSFDYIYFQMFNLYMIPVIITSGYFIVNILTNGKKGARILYLIAILLCFPMHVYVPFIYGEISSTALVLASVWALLSGLRKFKWYKPLLTGLFLGIAIQLRRNTLICLIAIWIVVLIHVLLHKNYKNIVFLVAAVVLPFLLQFGVDTLYKPHEVQEEYGMPSSSYIAMGLNDYSEMGPGWYDNSVIDTYIYKAKSDVSVAKEISKEHIKERLSYMWDNKAYAVGFYKKKCLSQWNDPLYLCLKMSGGGVTESESGGLVYDIYFGEGREAVLAYTNVYQLVIYFLVFVVSLLEGIRKDGEYDIAFYTLLIAIFGGFLFSLLWEAKSRYVFPYFVFMIPYAAIGMDKLYGIIKRHELQKNDNE